LETINKEGRWWRTPRISWDGIRHIKIEGANLYGEAFTPVGEMWVPFAVDLRTGECAGSAYEARHARSHTSRGAPLTAKGLPHDR